METTFYSLQSHLDIYDFYFMILWVKQMLLEFTRKIITVYVIKKHVSRKNALSYTSVV